MPWPLSIEGWEFHPVLESWITAPRAYDSDDGAPSSAIRLYAVSSAVRGGKAIRVRYLHPRGTKVLCLQTGACPRDDGDGYYPCGLETPAGWPRSVVPRRDQEPDDVCRVEERDHLLDLWGDVLGLDVSESVEDEGGAES